MDIVITAMFFELAVSAYSIPEQLSKKWSRNTTFLARTVIHGACHTGSEQRARRGYLRSIACLEYCRAIGFNLQGKRVLDLGGASGRVLEGFVEAGAEAYVVDMTRVETIRNVKILGSDINDIPQGMNFDLIICSRTGAFGRASPPSRIVSKQTSTGRNALFRSSAGYWLKSVGGGK